MSKKASSFDEFKAELKGLLEKHNLYVFESENHDNEGGYRGSLFYLATNNASWPCIEIGDLMQQIIETDT